MNMTPEEFLEEMRAGHNQENTLDFMENLILEKKNLCQEDEPAFVSELER